MAQLFGARVRRLRREQGLTQSELGRKVHVVDSRIAQIEANLGAKPSLQLATALDAALGADNLLVELWPYVYREAFPDWARSYVERESRATTIRKYEPCLVTGLLQTPEYARALLRVGDDEPSEAQVEERLTARLKRQERVMAADGPELRAVLDEAVLMRPIGGARAMREQLAHLLKVAERPRISLHVLPFRSGEQPSTGMSLTLLSLAGGGDAAYVEGGYFGQLLEENPEVRSKELAYHRILAQALPTDMSLDVIHNVMEERYRASRIPTRSQRRHVAQEQLQQSAGRRLRRGGRRAR